MSDEARLVAGRGRVAFQIHAAVVGADAVDDGGVLGVVVVIIEHHYFQRGIVIVGYRLFAGLQHLVEVRFLFLQQRAGRLQLFGAHFLGADADAGAAGVAVDQDGVGEPGFEIAGAVVGAVGGVVILDRFGGGQPQLVVVAAHAAAGQYGLGLRLDRRLQRWVLHEAQPFAGGVAQLEGALGAEQAALVGQGEAGQRRRIAAVVLQQRRGVGAAVGVEEHGQRAGEALVGGGFAQGLGGVGLAGAIGVALHDGAHAGQVIGLVRHIGDQLHHLAGGGGGLGVGGEQRVAVGQLLDAGAQHGEQIGVQRRQGAAAGQVVAGAQVEGEVDQSHRACVVRRGFLGEASGDGVEVGRAVKRGGQLAVQREQAVGAGVVGQAGQVVGQGRAAVAGHGADIRALRDGGASDQLAFGLADHGAVVRQLVAGLSVAWRTLLPLPRRRRLFRPGLRLVRCFLQLGRGQRRLRQQGGGQAQA